MQTVVITNMSLKGYDSVTLNQQVFLTFLLWPHSTNLHHSEESFSKPRLAQSLSDLLYFNGLMSQQLPPIAGD